MTEVPRLGKVKLFGCPVKDPSDQQDDFDFFNTPEDDTTHPCGTARNREWCPPALVLHRCAALCARLLCAAENFSKLFSGPAWADMREQQHFNLLALVCPTPPAALA